MSEICSFISIHWMKPIVDRMASLFLGFLFSYAQVCLAIDFVQFVVIIKCLFYPSVVNKLSFKRIKYHVCQWNKSEKLADSRVYQYFDSVRQFKSNSISVAILFALRRNYVQAMSMNIQYKHRQHHYIEPYVFLRVVVLLLLCLYQLWRLSRFISFSLSRRLLRRTICSSVIFGFHSNSTVILCVSIPSSARSVIVLQSKLHFFRCIIDSILRTIQYYRIKAKTSTVGTHRFICKHDADCINKEIGLVMKSNHNWDNVHIAQTI